MLKPDLEKTGKSNIPISSRKNLTFDCSKFLNFLTEGVTL